MSRTLEPGVTLLTAAEIRVVSSVVICVCILLHSSRSGLLTKSHSSWSRAPWQTERLGGLVVCSNTLAADVAVPYCCLQVVVPIGPMPRDTFESYLEALNVHRHVSKGVGGCASSCTQKNTGDKDKPDELMQQQGGALMLLVTAQRTRRSSTKALQQLGRSYGVSSQTMRSS